MRKVSSTAVAWLIFAGMFGSAAPVLAQTSVDSAPQSYSAHTQEAAVTRYQAAEAVLPQHIDELIMDVSVRPIWETDSARFVYVRSTPKGPEYKLVDPDQRRISPLFTPDQIRTIGMEGGASGTAEKLGNLRWKERGVLAFSAKGKDWLYHVDTAALNAAPVVADDESLSPDGKWIAFTREGNLYVRALLGGESVQLTLDGTPEQPYARPVVNPKIMVAKQSETPPIAPDVLWSPDSQKLVTYRVDDKAARRLSMMQSTPPNGAPPKSFTYDYTFSGDTTPPAATTVVIDLAKRLVVKADLPAEAILYYGGPEYLWTADSKAVLTRRAERGYHKLTGFRIDAETGKASVLAQSVSDTYVDYYGHFWGYEKRAKSLFWLGDRNGFAHLDVVGEAGGARHPLTNGPWRARSVAGVDPSGKSAFVVGQGRETGRDPYLRSLYAVSLKDSQLRNLTPEPLDHDVSVSPDGRWFLDNMSLVNQPTRSVLRATSDGSIAMEVSRADATAYLAAGYTFPEPFEALAADGRTRLYGAIYRPRDFNSKANYPVIENIYTGPHYVMTPKSFEAGLFGRNANSMAQLGAVAITIDGRGTWGRSREFHQQAYGRLHSIGVDDHVAVIGQLGKRFSWFDASRVGVYGFSAGGYDVVRMMTEAPDVYKVGVSASGNHDNRLDKAEWNEQWLGQELGDVYERNSNVVWADKLVGKIFLAHGELDENVPLSATMRLVERLIANNRDFEFLIVPNADHYLDESPYFQRRRFDFFTKELLGSPVPVQFQMRPFPKDS